MQLNKCSRCGCFFMTDDSVCPNCKPKDMCDINILKDFLEEASTSTSIGEIVCETGISSKNLHRFFSSEEFSKYNYSSLDPEPKSEL